MSNTQGYDDWQRTDQQIGPVLASVVAGHANPGYASGAFYTGVWPALNIAISALTVGTNYTVTVTWFADHALAQQIGQRIIYTDNGTPIVEQLVNLGPWATITITTVTVAPNDRFTLLAVPMKVASPSAKPVPGLILGGIFSSLIAAGATTAVFSTVVQGCRASFSIGSNAGTLSRGILLASIPGGGYTPICTLEAGVAPNVYGNQSLVVVPTTMLRIDVTNLGGAGDRFFAVVIPQP